MSTTTSDLLNRANIIKNETLEGKNSAVRVGSLFWDIISKMEGNTSKLSTLEELINSGGSRYSNVRVTPVYTNGVLIATIRVGVQDYAIYAPGKGGPGSDSDGYDSDGYDDSEIRREIDRLKSDLNNILEREKAGIKDMVEEILAGKNFINGWQAGWSEKLQSYLISVGVLGPDGKSKGWAYLDTKYNSLEGAVNRLSALGQENKGLYETLQARLRIFIDEDFAGLKRVVTELGNRYALTSEEGKVLKWLTAQLYMEVTNDKSLAELYAAAGDLASTQEALASLRTEVRELDGKFVAKTSLTSQVSNALGQLYVSGLISKSTLGEAVATLFAEGNDPSFGRIESKITAYVKDGIAGIKMDTEILEAIAKQVVLDTARLRLIADQVDVSSATINIDADQVIAALKDLSIRVSNFMIGGEPDKDTVPGKDLYRNNMYIHTIKNGVQDIIQGMEFVFGNFTVSRKGDVNEFSTEEGGVITKLPCLRTRFMYYYLDAPKIVTSQIMFPTQNLNGPSYLDFNQNSVIRWFDIVGNPEDERKRTGDEYGFYRDGNNVEHLGTNDRNGENHPAYDANTTGYITFNGHTITIHGNVEVIGTVSHGSEAVEDYWNKK